VRRPQCCAAVPRSAFYTMNTVETSALEQPARPMWAPTPSENVEASPPHFGFIDALRGVAILAVIMVHVTQQISGGPMMRFGPKGAFGVQLFFVISAFTLFWSLRSRMGIERRPVAAYFVRRLFRIAPLFWIATLFYAYHPGYWRAMFAPNGVGAKQILATVLFVHGWSPLTCNAVVPGGWSIATEATFYLFVPFLFQRVRTLTNALWFALISAVLVSIFAPIATTWLCRLYPASWKDLIAFFVDTSFPSQVPVFCLGMVLYFIIINRMPPARNSPHPSTVLKDRRMALLLTMLAPALFLSPDLPEQVTWALAFVALSTALAIHPFRVVVNPVTRFFGTISFSAYIWHFWIIQVIAIPLFSLMGLKSFSDSGRGTLQFLALYPIVIVLTAAVSFASYHLIEAPGQNLGKAVIDYFNWGRNT